MSGNETTLGDGDTCREDVRERREDVCEGRRESPARSRLSSILATRPRASKLGNNGGRPRSPRSGLSAGRPSAYLRSFSCSNCLFCDAARRCCCVRGAGGSWDFSSAMECGFRYSCFRSRASRSCSSCSRLALSSSSRSLRRLEAARCAALWRRSSATFSDSARRSSRCNFSSASRFFAWVSFFLLSSERWRKRSCAFFCRTSPISWLSFSWSYSASSCCMDSSSSFLANSCFFL
mmetsp:Transcript_62242/g.136285  ORF Transcript_62242/g.136285 Transcript_62242/m.136285 type:complete len:235 (+) Transcript_62242:370-1074(+)